jgi:hypothetical protein
MVLQAVANFAYQLIPEEVVAQAATLRHYVASRVDQLARGDMSRAYKTTSATDNEKFLASRQWFYNPHRADLIKTLSFLSLCGGASVYYMRRVHFVSGFVATCFIGYNLLATLQRYREGNALKKALEIIFGNLDSLPVATRHQGQKVWVSMDTKMGRLTNAQGKTDAVVIKETAGTRTIYKVYYIGSAYFTPSSHSERNTQVESWARLEGTEIAHLKAIAAPSL